MDAYERLDPRMRQWIWRQGWDDLKTVQRNAIEPILEHKNDVVISAATAGGKTEAAFLPIFTYMLQNPALSGFQALAVSPLKALINDQTRRLEDMATDTEIAVSAWHGDISQSLKNGIMRNPSGLLIITPESLEAMLALRSHWAAEAFKHLKYIVVDELHAFIGAERGIQLQSLLARLDRMADIKPVRIGLSATIADHDEAAAFLRPDSSRQCVFPDSGGAQGQALISIKEFVANDKLDPKTVITQELFNRLRGTNNLVFTNSRKDAEAYMLALDEMSAAEHVPCEFTLHHGSLSRQDRHDVEHSLQKGHHPVTAICTASMELGVDIGQVSSVAQIGTASSPQALRQRLGRSGRRGQPAIMRIFSIDEQRDDYKFHLRTNLVQNIAAVELMGKGIYDSPTSPMAYVSIVVQQLLSLLSQHGSLYPSDAYGLLCGPKGVFSMLSTEDFGALLRHLGQKRVLSQLNSGQLVVGTEGERLLGGRDFFSAFTTVPDYLIVDKATGRSIGNVQYKPFYGEVFVLAGQKWIVDAVEDRSRTVQASHTHATGKMMFEGSGIEASCLLTTKMREIYASTDVYPYLDVNTATPNELQMARQWFARHSLATQSWVSNGDSLAFFTWGGMATNRAIALMADSFLGIKPTYDHLALTGLTPANIEALGKHIAGQSPLALGEKLAAHGSTSSESSLLALGEKLAAEVPLAKKTRGKFDPYLPPTLLNRQYAANRLNIPAAINILCPSYKYSHNHWIPHTKSEE